MTVYQRSVLAWLAGGVVGLAVAKKRKVTGALMGAAIVGAFADKLIEQGERTGDN